jgi:lon-related putative ATP-dependent protease
VAEATRLSPDQLIRACDPEKLGFETTADLEDLHEAVGQQRAVDAVRFAAGVRSDGYNLFAMGPPATGRHEVVLSFLREEAAGRPVPDDVCYVHDFLKPDEPKALILPPGAGRDLRGDMERLVEDLRIAIPSALEGDELRQRKQAIEDGVKRRHDQAFAELRLEAEKQGIALLHTPMGFSFAPVRDGEVLAPEEFEALPEKEQERLESQTEELQRRLQETIAQFRTWAKEARAQVRELLREITTAAVEHLLDDLRGRWAKRPAVVAHLDAVQADVVENVEDIVGLAEDAHSGPGSLPGLGGSEGPAPLRRYLVNLFVDNAELEGAPVVREDHPNHENLFGAIEHLAQQGALVTDLHLLKPGSLHRANGGTLVIDARELLVQPFAYEGLKRALKAKEARLESLGRTLSLVSTASLKPEPIPLDVKVVLLGERLLYYLLDAHDADFSSLFKVVADFDDELARDRASEAVYARFIATVVRAKSLRPLDRAAVARVIEQGARMAGDGERLSAQIGRVEDLLHEASHWAQEVGRAVVGAADVQRAIDESERRSGRVRERLIEELRRGTILIETEGERIGQVNGLSVLQLAGHAFGRPCRISCRVSLGAGKLVDIEREVELGGPLHSKGVLILQGLLAARYARDHPLSLSATLVFEQSYGAVDGDSASCAELCALLSALAEIPIRQGLAITGSVDQEGRVQAIGGVNEKVEGFFDACLALGGVAGRGVIVPRANVKHLMLRRDVIESVRAGDFALHAVSTVDEALTLLTGRPAGERTRGRFPRGSVNAAVEKRLVALARRRLELGRASRGSEES